MPIPKTVKKQILEAIAATGDNIATIKEIEQKVSVERHALSKYLHLMKREGYLYYKDVGKAKVWFINKAPLKSIFNKVNDDRTYSEKVLYNLVSKLPVGVILMDMQLNILFSNTLLEKKYGALVGKKFYLDVLGIKKPYVLKDLFRIIDYHEEEVEFTIKDKEGNTLNVLANKFENPDNSISIILIISDITKSVASQKNLRLTRALFRDLINKSPDCLIYTDTGGIVVKINKIALKHLGNYNDTDIKEHPLSKFMTKDSGSAYAKSIMGSKEYKNPVPIELDIIKKNKKVEKCRFELSSVPGRDGRTRGYLLRLTNT